MIDLGWSLRFKVVVMGVQPTLSSTAECTVRGESPDSYLLMNTSCMCILVAASHESMLVT